MNTRTETETRMGFLMERIQTGEIEMREESMIGFGVPGGATILTFTAANGRRELDPRRGMGWKNRVPVRKGQAQAAPRSRP